jgi:hypothetical protein
MKQFVVLILVSVGFLYTSNAAEPAPAPPTTTEFRYINGKAEPVADWPQLNAWVIGVAQGGLLVQEWVYEERTYTATTGPRRPRLNRLQRIGAYSGGTIAGSNVIKTREVTYMEKTPTTKALILHYWANRNPQPYSPFLAKAKFMGTREILVPTRTWGGNPGAPVKETVNVYDFGLRSPTR